MKCKLYLNKLFIFVCVVLIICLEFGCDCSRMVNCPSLSSEGRNWIATVISLNDTIQYKSTSGEIINFSRHGQGISSPYSVNECESIGLFKCDCSEEHRCRSNGSILYYADSGFTPSNTGQLRCDINEYADELMPTGFRRSYTIKIYDFILSMNNELTVYQDHQFHSSIDIGGVTYEDVYEIENDTTPIQYYSQRKVWKAFFKMNVGIIAFQERPSQRLFIKQ